MKRTSLTLAGGLATALMLVTAPTAHAAVKSNDLPSKGDIVKAFPVLADAEFTTDKAKTINVVGKDCGTAATQKAKSAVTTSGYSTTTQSLAVVGVAEVKNEAQAKGYLKTYKAYLKKCPTFTEPTSGATITASKGKDPKLGDESMTVVQETVVAGTTAYSTTVLVRDGKRLASVAVLDDAPVSASAIKKLAKVAAKKMK
jgi:hypothetical protein